VNGLQATSGHTVQFPVVKDSKAVLFYVEGKEEMPYRLATALTPRNQALPDHVTMANVRQSGWHQSGVSVPLIVEEGHRSEQCSVRVLSEECSKNFQTRLVHASLNQQGFNHVATAPANQLGSRQSGVSVLGHVAVEVRSEMSCAWITKDKCLKTAARGTNLFIINGAITSPAQRQLDD